MNKAKIGNKKEVLVTKKLNKKDLHWKKLPYDKNTTFAIHIKSKKFGELNQEKVQSKADIFFAKSTVDPSFLEKNKFYLNESHLDQFNLKPIPKSGLSIKLPKSKYTICKISANTFKKIFKSNLLGAGAAIYSTRGFEKNKAVIAGWGIAVEEFKNFFSRKLGIETIDLFDKKIMGQIKTYSNEEIKKTILESKTISDLVFKGIGNFEEPFTAHWILENDVIKENYFMPFTVTTGSGRGKNIFTIVLKPKDI